MEKQAEKGQMEIQTEKGKAKTNKRREDNTRDIH